MKKKSRFVGFLEWGALFALVISLILVIKFLRVNAETTYYPGLSPASTSQPAANLAYPEPIAEFTATSESLLSQPYPAPESLPESVYQVPPPCQANANFLPSTMGTGSASQNYIFSEPRTISTQFPLIDIIQWLPDNRRVLLLAGDEKGQLIETIDVISNEIRIYARNLEDPGFVLWVPEEQGVAYADRKMQSDGNILSTLMLSTGISETQILLMKEFQYIGDGNPVPDNLPETLSQKINPVFSFEPQKWEYDKFHSEATEVWRRLDYKAAISPNGAMTAFYSPPWLLLVDSKTGQPCEIDLTPFAVRAREVQWSDSGRYLAILAANDYPGMLLQSNRIAIFDLASGKLVHFDEVQYVAKMDWLRNTDYLLISGYNDATTHANHLYIIPINEMKLDPVLPEYTFWAAIGRGPDHILSPDGQFVAIQCQDGNLCVISIDSKP